MTHRHHVALVALMVASVGCGSSTAQSPSPSVVNAGSDVSLTPTEVDVERFASICGVDDPPFTDGDLFSLDIIGKKTVTPPYGAITFSCSRNVKIGEPMVLTVGPFQSEPAAYPGAAPYEQQSATLPSDSALNFAFEWGSDPSEVDPAPFDSATVTVLAFPTKDGEPLTVRVQMHFTDGRRLDETFSGPLSTGFSGCPQG